MSRQTDDVEYAVVLVDEHTLLREGIKTIIERSGDFRVIGEAENGSDAVRLCRELQPDMVLIDIALPGMNGIEATSEILRHCPKTKVLILTMYDDEHTVVEAFRSGVRAFVAKKASSADLVDALRAVAKGGSYLSSQASSHLLRRIQQGDLESSELPSALRGLSPREQQILRLVAEGKTTKEIADMLGLEPGSVRTYRKTMMKKMGVTNVAGLTQVAFVAGLANWGKSDPKAGDPEG